MRKSFPILALLASASLLSAQTDSNSITVTASRNTNLQSDQALFSVSVSSDLNASFEDVLGALQGSGIALSNFTAVYTSFASLTGVTPTTGPFTPPVPGLLWSFSFSAPLSKIKDTLATLNTVQQNVVKKNNGMSVSFGVVGAQVSPQLQQSQGCSLPDLIADARAQAQKLADAANLGVGVILAMSGATTGGNPSSIGISGISTILIPSVANCTLTVKFALQRF
jgi:uncharacterized protein YggE